MAPLQPRKLQIGVVGIGRMGRRHALNILHLTPRADLLCACSPAQPDIEWANEAIIPHGTKVYSTFEEMIETPGLEAVIIASATAMHASQSRIALERGIHVLCEKPVTFSLEEVCFPSKRNEKKLDYLLRISSCNKSLISRLPCLTLSSWSASLGVLTTVTKTHDRR